MAGDGRVLSSLSSSAMMRERGEGLTDGGREGEARDGDREGVSRGGREREEGIDCNF